MQKSARVLISGLLCASMAFVTTACNTKVTENTETTNATVESMTVSEAATTQSTTAPKKSTDDTPIQPATYNFVKLKEKSSSVMNEFDNYINKKKYNGVVYYKIGNDFEYIGNNGNANIESHTLNSINTCYYVGSITKQFTATAIYLLAEQKMLSIDDKLDKYYPDYEYGSEITIYNLLTMTSGIKSYLSADGVIDNSYSSNGIELSKDNSAEENKALIMDWILSQDLLFKPDSGYKFSDSNYYLLGDIIEKVSGKNYYDYVKENIFTPLGMNTTGFEYSSKAANAYQGDDSNSYIYYDGVGYSSSGLITSVSDLLKWVYAFDENEILSKESIDKMLTPYKENYASGLFVNGNRLYQSSKFDAYNSMLSFERNESEIFVTLSNYKNSNSVILYSSFKNILSPFWD